MLFSIHQVQEQGLDLLLLKDEHSGIEVAILPGFGAILHGITLSTSHGKLNVIDHYDSLEQLTDTLNRSYKSSKLSPFPCRILDGKYHHAGRDYEFRDKFPDGSAIHGLLFDKPFKLTEQLTSIDSASLKMEYAYRKDDPAYPFDYTCQVVYTLLHDGVLQVATTVINDGKEAIPIADGWHPYFQLGGKVDEWLMSFQVAAMVEFNDRLVPTGKLLDYDHFNLPAKIGKTELDNCFLLELKNGHAACELFNPVNKIKIGFYPDSSYPYLQVYTPPHRNSIAIENLSSAPDSFNNKMGLLILKPARTQTFTLQYKLSML